MKRKLPVIVLLAISALLCSCNDPNEAGTDPAEIVTEINAAEPADCCAGDIPDCCKQKETSESDCCNEKEVSESDCCKEKDESKADCCKEESESDCCKHNES